MGVSVNMSVHLTRILFLTWIRISHIFFELHLSLISLLSLVLHREWLKPLLNVLSMSEGAVEEKHKKIKVMSINSILP